MSDKEIKFDILKDLGTLTQDTEQSEYIKKAKLISWNDAEPSIDVRVWKQKPNGTETPCKGISLTPAEAEILKDLLAAIN